MKIDLTKKEIDDAIKEYECSQKKQRVGAKDETITKVMDEAKKRKYMTRNDLVAVADWKYAPNKKNCQKNNDGFVEKVTKIAFAIDCDEIDFAPDCDEEVRIKILQIIDGVSWAMASVILHFYFPKKYPILDWRAMKAVKKDTECGFDKERDTKYDFAKWQKYTKVCRDFAKKHDLTMRELDKALWIIGGKKD